MSTAARRCALALLLATVACSRGEQTPPATAPTASPAPAAQGQPPALVVGDDDEVVVVDGFQFFVEATDPEAFEIDADATDFLGYAPMLVDFGAVALNGTPPVTFTWNFGDGSEPATGDRVSHLFEKTGRIDVLVTGEDASGEKSTVQLALVIFSREDWAEERGLDAATLPTPTPRP